MYSKGTLTEDTEDTNEPINNNEGNIGNLHVYTDT